MFHAEPLRTSLLVGIALASAAVARLPLETRTDCLRYRGSIHLSVGGAPSGDTQKGWLDKGQDIADQGGVGGRFRTIYDGPGDDGADQGIYFFVNCFDSPFHVYCESCDSNNGMDLLLGIEKSGDYWFPTALGAASPDTEVFQRNDGDQSLLWLIDWNYNLTPYYNGANFTQDLWIASTTGQADWDTWWGEDSFNGNSVIAVSVGMQFVSFSDPVSVSMGPPVDSSSFLCEAA